MEPWNATGNTHHIILKSISNIDLTLSIFSDSSGTIGSSPGRSKQPADVVPPPLGRVSADGRLEPKPEPGAAYVAGLPNGLRPPTTAFLAAALPWRRTHGATLACP